MRRVDHVFGSIITFANLLEASKKAARGKSTRPAVARFLVDRERECLRLVDELRAGRYRPGPLRTAVVHEPKRRDIHIAPFRDRVVHHAVVGVFQPIWTARMMPQSHACMPGKGNWSALADAQRWSRRWPWVAKTDIRRCFPSMHHAVVLHALQRICKDARALELFRVLIQHGTCSNVGLPIGSLTSQWFVNWVLTGLDRHMVHELGCRGYVRYMDDILVFAASRSEARLRLRSISAFVQDRLALELKSSATLVGPTRYAVPFLGWRVFPRHLQIRRANARRIFARATQIAFGLGKGRGTQTEAACRLGSAFAHLARGDTLTRRREWLARHCQLLESIA